MAISKWHSAYGELPAKPAQLGYITQINMGSYPIMDLTDMNTVIRSFTPIGLPSLEFTCLVPHATPAVFDSLHNWLLSGKMGWSFPDEFKCLYCGTINTVLTVEGLIRSFCMQCGGPRSYILG